MADTATLLAYAREIVAGDQIGDKTVKSVAEGDGTVTITYKGGDIQEYALEDEVTIVRDLAKVVFKDDAAEKLLAAHRPADEPADEDAEDAA